MLKGLGDCAYEIRVVATDLQLWMASKGWQKLKNNSWPILFMFEACECDMHFGALSDRFTLFLDHHDPPPDLKTPRVEFLWMNTKNSSKWPLFPKRSPMINHNIPSCFLFGFR